MYKDLDIVRLKDGETVQAGVVTTPDLEWAERLEKFLIHKGEPWNWQNSVVLHRETGIEVYYYILHRQGEPFSFLMNAELSGVGILGHIWTTPEGRHVPGDGTANGGLSQAGRKGLVPVYCAQFSGISYL